MEPKEPGQQFETGPHFRLCSTTSLPFEEQGKNILRKFFPFAKLPNNRTNCGFPNHEVGLDVRSISPEYWSMISFYSEHLDYILQKGF